MRSTSAPPASSAAATPASSSCWSALTGADSSSSHAAMRYPESVSCRGGGSSRRQAWAASSVGPAMTSMSSPRSAEDRASGPMTLTSATVPPPRGSSRYPVAGVAPNDGLWPKMPLNDAGIRMDPPMSVPISKEVKPEATAAAAPPRSRPAPWTAPTGCSWCRRCRCSSAGRRRSGGGWSGRTRPHRRRAPCAPAGRRGHRCGRSARWRHPSTGCPRPRARPSR